jgi:uncharacterized membrane protein YvbJ
MPYCKFCGIAVNLNKKFCIECGKPITDQENFNIPEQSANIYFEQNITAEATNTLETKRKLGSRKIGILLLVAFIIACITLGFFILNKKASKKNLVVLAESLNLRSSKDEISKENIINNYVYGTNLEVVSDEGEWFKMKASDGNEGYMKKLYLDDMSNFIKLNAIISTAPEDSIIKKETRVKKSLLNYFETNQMIGNITKEDKDNYFAKNDSWEKSRFGQ